MRERVSLTLDVSVQPLIDSAYCSKEHSKDLEHRASKQKTYLGAGANGLGFHLNQPQQPLPSLGSHPSIP